MNFRGKIVIFSSYLFIVHIAHTKIYSHYSFFLMKKKKKRFSVRKKQAKQFDLLKVVLFTKLVFVIKWQMAI